jgi:hypothetical protein
LHRLSSTFVLGYHGCDRDVGESLIAGTPFIASENDYDWLGPGVYFWEANPRRGLEFAQELQRWRKGKASEIKEPFVVGAVIEMGFCLDLTTSTGIQAVVATHQDFLDFCSKVNADVPVNAGGRDLVFRKLDCAVIGHVHKIRQAAGLQAFDTVKGVFLEGDRIYPESGFFEKTHIQLCVRDLTCIKGVFRVPEDQLAG